MAITVEDGRVKGWTFAVVGLSTFGTPRYIGFQESYEDAVTYQGNMEKLGWRNVKIYNVNRQEVTEKPSDLS